MSIIIRKHPTETDTFDIFSGKFRLGVIKPIFIGDAGIKTFSWVISTVSMGGEVSGSAKSVELAVAAVAQRWQRWLQEAELAETQTPTRPSSKQ